MRHSHFGALLGAGLVIAATAGRSSSEPAYGPPIDLPSRTQQQRVDHPRDRGRRTAAHGHGDRSAAAGDGGLPRGPQHRRDHAEERPQLHLGLADDRIQQRQSVTARYPQRPEALASAPANSSPSRNATAGQRRMLRYNARNSWHKSLSAWKKRPTNSAFPRTAEPASRSRQSARLSRRRELEIPQRRHRQARGRRHSANRSGASDLALDLGRRTSTIPAAADDASEPTRPTTAEVGRTLKQRAEPRSTRRCRAGPASDISLEDVDEPTVAGLDDDGSERPRQSMTIRSTSPPIRFC